MAGYGGFSYMGMPGLGFPSYTTPNNTPNSYSGAQSQMSNPYSQQATQPVSSNGLPGRMVNSENDIVPNEIPMDGTVAFFPKSDYSCIYARALNSDFTPRTIKFVPETQIAQNPVTDEPTTTSVVNDDLLEKLNEKFDSRFDDLERLIKRNNNNRNYKKSYKKPYDKNNQNGSGKDE